MAELRKLGYTETYPELPPGYIGSTMDLMEPTDVMVRRAGGSITLVEVKGRRVEAQSIRALAVQKRKLKAVFAILAAAEVTSDDRKFAERNGVRAVTFGELATWARTRQVPPVDEDIVIRHRRTVGVESSVGADETPPVIRTGRKVNNPQDR